MTGQDGDESQDFVQRTAGLAMENWGRIVGLDIMLRTLYAKLALEQPQPVEFAEATKNAMIDSMRKQLRSGDQVEAHLAEHAAEQIEDTMVNVITRVKDQLSRR